MKTKELIFIVEESLEGGYEAKAVGESIFTEGETVDDLKKNIAEAVRCHFDENNLPAFVNLRFQREEIITLLRYLVTFLQINLSICFRNSGIQKLDKSEVTSD
jgi:predicted RNase H-like HicB family nuclease